MTYAAVILAAGRAERYRAAGGSGASKLLADLDGQPLVRHVALAALASRASPVCLVTGHAGDEVVGAVADLAVARVHNPRFAEGLASSLRVGLSAVPPTCAGALVLLADMPGISATTLDALMAQAALYPEADAVVPVVGGRRGNPVLLSRTLFAAAERLGGDIGARQLLRDLGLKVVELVCDDPALLLDVDLPEHVVRAQAARSVVKPS